MGGLISLFKAGYDTSLERAPGLLSRFLGRKSRRRSKRSWSTRLLNIHCPPVPRRFLLARRRLSRRPGSPLISIACRIC